MIFHQNNTGYKLLKGQRGLTLIELMIAMLLSLIVVFAVSNILITSNRTATLAESVAQSQETGRYVISYLNRFIMRAGFSPNGEALTPFEVACVDPNNPDNTCSLNSDEGTGDRISIVRILDEDGLSCAGTDVGLVPELEVVDVFWIAIDDDGNRNLMCLTYDRATQIAAFATDGAQMQAQPIAQGVISMHVLYGMANDPTTVTIGGRNVSRYVNATQVDADGDGISQESDWLQIYALKLVLLTESFEQIAGESRESRYILADATPYQFNDRFSRQIFSTTIARANF